MRGVLQIGPTYLKVCEELEATVAPHLAAVVQLALYTAAAPAASPRLPLLPKRPPEENNAHSPPLQANPHSLSRPRDGFTQTRIQSAPAKQGRRSPSDSARKYTRCADSSRSPTVAERDPVAAQSLPPPDVKVQIICNDTVGTLYPASCKVISHGKQMTATQFEQYAGAGSAKKWKASLRVLPGQVQECPHGSRPLCTS